ncbi:MAG TPA: endonuclease [Pelagibacterium sp.]|nr:endonuclease [Pelagibacterium sp.]HCO54691.1 endonuclease [Pelagibacterium sp.]
MPSRAPSICPYCQQAHHEPCETARRLRRERNARHDAKRPNSSRRGYDGAFEREAKAFLARPENKTCACGAPAVLVRHRISIRLRSDLRMDQSNWMPGCRRCNSLDAVAERRT